MQKNRLGLILPMVGDGDQRGSRTVRLPRQGDISLSACRLFESDTGMATLEIGRKPHGGELEAELRCKPAALRGILARLRTKPVIDVEKRNLDRGDRRQPRENRGERKRVGPAGKADDDPPGLRQPEFLQPRENALLQSSMGTR
jgi:hypothetical protein